MGDASYAHDNMYIKANGITKASGINTGLNQFLCGEFTVTVTAGNLQLEFGDAGGIDPCWVINSIVLSPNVAMQATVTVSSTYPGYSATGAIDGVVDGYPNDYTKEWASNCEKAGAWLKLNWYVYKTIRKIKIYDRINLNDQVTSGNLTWNGGQVYFNSPLPNSGQSPLVIELLSPSSTWLQFNVDGVSLTTYAAGLAEIEVYE